MDSQLSKTSEALARLRESMAHADWEQVESIASRIRLHTIPSTPEALGEYLTDLKATLVAVKAGRANLKVSRARLNAAAGFGASAIETSSGRHNSAVSPGF
jgi:hypothetical protein